ncbi:MAG: ribbon-helix-helix domain-containing protein [Betaproteobacteria bacterium]
MESAVLTLRINTDIKDKLDKLALATHRSKSFLAAEAINRYLEMKLGKLVKLNWHW